MRPDQCSTMPDLLRIAGFSLGKTNSHINVQFDSGAFQFSLLSFWISSGQSLDTCRSRITALSVCTLPLEKSMDSLTKSLVYPPNQYSRRYHDASSEEASIHGEDEAFLEKPSPARSSQTQAWRQSCCNTSTISILISIITTTAFILLVLITTNGHPIRILKQSDLYNSLSLHGHGPVTPSKSSPAEKLHCGTTPAEARALGCKFDIMSFAWTPPSCYDHARSQSFLSTHGPWTFYLDHNATIPLSTEDLSNHEVIWTEHGYHVVHCLYAWERLHRASLLSSSSEQTGVLVPGEMANLNHTMHCVGLLGEGEMVERRKVNAVAYLVFDGCVGI